MREKDIAIYRSNHPFVFEKSQNKNNLFLTNDTGKHEDLFPVKSWQVCKVTTEHELEKCY